MPTPRPDDLTELFLSLSRFYVAADSSRNTWDLNIAEEYVVQAREYVQLLHTFALRGDEILTERFGGDGTSSRNEISEVRSILSQLMDRFLTLLYDFNSRVQSLLGECPIPHDIQVDCIPTLETRARGRPRFVLRVERIEALWSLGFSWDGIAKILGVSPRTLRHRRQHDPDFQNLSNGYSQMSDDQLDRVLCEIRTTSQRCGETLMIGALRSRGLRVQRRRVRASLARIDPVGRALRRRRVIYRRHYSVPHPNFLWHVDGNHKLIDPWGFVVHGGIDGYSRMCVFLKCSTNNCATTALEAFQSAVGQYGLPSRVRTDYGTENVEIGRMMLRTRGLNRGSIICGRSTHNQRIERLWRDVRECVLNIFIDIFYYMEQILIADRYNELHLFAIRYVFLPRINRALAEFREQWNNHPIRTARQQTPNQLWIAGMLQNREIGQELSEPYEFYGIDHDEQLEEVQTQNNVEVPEIDLNLSEEQEGELLQRFPPGEDDGNEGIQLFLNVVEFLSHIVS